MRSTAQRRTTRRMLLAACVAVGLAILLFGLRLGRGTESEPGTPPPPLDSRAAGIPAKETGRSQRRRASTPPLSGEVRAAAGNPIEGASVCVTCWYPDCGLPGPPRSSCTVTDATGHYLFSQLGLGSYQIVATAAGYEPGWPIESGGTSNAPVLIGGASEQRHFELRPGGEQVIGRILDASGGTIAGALVQAGLGNEGSPLIATQSDTEGRFELVVQPGVAALRASASGYATAFRAIRAPSRAVDLVLIPGATLLGEVISSHDGAPQAGIDVIANRASELLLDSGVAQTRSDSAGRFVISGVPAGEYRLIARGRGVFGRTATTTKVEMGRSSPPITLRVDPALTVSGRVIVAPEGRPCPNAAVSLVPETDPYLELTALTDREGGARLENVPPDSYRVRVTSPEFVATQQQDPLRVGLRDVFDLTWTVTSGLYFSGRAVDEAGNAVAGQEVSAFPLDDDRATSTSATTQTNERGEFSIGDMAPGDYRVVTGQQVDDAVVVRLDPAQAAPSVTLVVHPSSTIHASLQAESGAPPLDQVTVRAIGAGARLLARELSVGEYEIADLSPGTYTVSVSDGRNPPIDTTVEAAAGGTTYVRVLLRAHHGVIRGRVLDSRGQPVTDAWVRVGSTSANGPFDALDPMPKLAGVDGSFELDGLDTGSYDVTAYTLTGRAATRSGVQTGDSVAIFMEIPHPEMHGTSN